jgi:chromosome segregation ATPase
MIFSNDDLVSIAEDSTGSLEMALRELEGVEEYKEEYEQIEGIIEAIKEKSEIYLEALDEELEKERESADRDYYHDTY